MRRSLYGLLALLSFSPAAHASGGASVVVDYAEKAMAKGYGTMCSLAMVPSTEDGYYSCIDFGPYRYVHEYQKVSGYVVGADKKPFKIMGGTVTNPEFTIGGPWEQDMAARAVMFWNDTVEGGSKQAESAASAAKEKQDAEAYIRGMMGDKSKSDAKTPGQTVAPTPPIDVAPQVTPEQTGQPLNVNAADIKAIIQQDKK